MKIFACFGSTCSPMSRSQTNISLKGENLMTLQQQEEVYRSAKTLVHLDLTGNRLRCLPQKFWKTKFPKLEVLILYDNDINVIGNDIKTFENLKELDVSRNELEMLPPDLGLCKKLEKLVLGANPMSAVPDELCNLVNLRILSSNGVSLMDLPNQIGKMKSLQVLEVRENLLRIVPDSLANLENLEQLDLGENELEELPFEIGRLNNLKELFLDKNQLTSLPESLAEMKSLENLDITMNEIEDLPKDLSGLVSICDMTLSENKITSIPHSIGNLKSLSILKIDNNQIDYLPDQIGQCSELTELILKANKLTQLPREISKLKKLVHLNADQNLLTCIPPEIGDLKQLTLLSLRENRLSKVPETLGNLTNLTVMDLASNSLKYLPLSFKKLGLRALWLAENQSQSLIQMQESFDETLNEDVLTCFLLPQMPANNRSFSSLGRLNNQATLDKAGLGGAAGGQRRTFEDLREEEFDGFDGEQFAERTRTVMIQLPSDANLAGKAEKEKIGDEAYFEDRKKQLTPHPHLRKELKAKAEIAVKKSLENGVRNGQISQNGQILQNGKIPLQEVHNKYEEEKSMQKLPEPLPKSSVSPSKHENPVSNPSSDAENAPDVSNSTTETLTYFRRCGMINTEFKDRQDQICITVNAAPQNGSKPSLGLSIAGGKNSPAFIDDDPSVYISKVMENGACSRAGLQGHDKIVAVNNCSLVGATHEDAVQILRESSSKNPSCIQFVVLRTRQVAEYNIKLDGSKTTPIDVEIDPEVNLLTITSVNQPTNVSLVQAVRPGDHLLRINQVDVASFNENQQFCHENEVFEEYLGGNSLNNFSWLNLLVLRPLVAKEELLKTAEVNVPNGVMNGFLELKEKVKEKKKLMKMKNAMNNVQNNVNAQNAQNAPKIQNTQHVQNIQNTQNHAQSTQNHNIPATNFLPDTHNQSSQPPPSYAIIQQQLQQQAAQGAAHAAALARLHASTIPENSTAESNMVASKTATTISSSSKVSNTSTLNPMNSEDESNRGNVQGNDYNPYARLHNDSPEVKPIEATKVVVTTRPIQLQQAETQEVEQPEIASPERLTFKDRMAMFAEQNTKTTKTTSSSNLNRNVRTGKVSLLSHQDMQRMNNENTENSNSSSSHTFENGQTHTQSNNSSFNQNSTQNGGLLSPESPGVDENQSVLQNFSKTSNSRDQTNPYQRFTDSQGDMNSAHATSNSNLVMINGNQPTKATDILKPRVQVGAQFKGNSLIRHTHQPSDVDTSSVFSFATNSFEKIEDIEREFRKATNAGVDDSAQSKRELEQLRKIKERQKRMNELDQEAYKAEQLIGQASK